MPRRRASLPVAILCLLIVATSLRLFTHSLRLTGFSKSFGNTTSSPISSPYHDPFLDLQPNAGIYEAARGPNADIQNQTLGFEKIYAISMPHRTDKRDYLASMGLASSLDITFVDGVNGSEMHPDAFPPYWKGSDTVGEYGCWRAHMNIYQHMLRNRVSSALILEDDADWDALLRAQLISLARGLLLLQNITLTTHSPYGDNWDILTLGHSGLNNLPTIPQIYHTTSNDPTVIAPSRRTWSRKPNLNTPLLAGNYTRTILRVHRFTSTTAYALSLLGAARLLHDQTQVPHARAIDVAISDFCARNTYNTPCYGAYPPLFGRFRGIGPKSRDSDRRTSSNDAQRGSGGGQAKDERVVPESEFTVFSVGLNLGGLLKGETVVKASDERDMLGSVDLRVFVMPDGEAVWVGRDEYGEE